MPTVRVAGETHQRPDHGPIVGLVTWIGLIFALLHDVVRCPPPISHVSRLDPSLNQSNCNHRRSFSSRVC